MNEEEVKYKLSTWLMKYIPTIEIRWEKKNDYGFETFKCKGSRKKPDLLFWIPNNGDKWFLSVVEVKIGDQSGALINSVKIVDYYKLTLEGKLRYFVCDEEIVPKYFLVATQYSPNGFLLKADKNRKLDLGQEWRKWPFQPRSEYPMAHRFVRHLWHQWKPYKDPRFKMGILVSDKIHDGTNQPAIFIQKYNWRKDNWLPPHWFMVLRDD